MILDIKKINMLSHDSVNARGIHTEEIYRLRLIIPTKAVRPYKA